MKDLTGAEAYEKSAIEMLEHFPGFEEVLAAAYNNRGGVYVALHLTKKAESDLEMALTIRERFKAQRPLDYTESLINLSDVKRGDEGEELARKAVEIRRNLKDLDPDGLVQALLPYGLAAARNGKLTDAEIIWSEAVKRADHPPDREIRALSLNNLGELYRRLRRWEESERYLTRSLDVWHNAKLDGKAGMLNTCVHYRDLFKDQNKPIKYFLGCPPS